MGLGDPEMSDYGKLSWDPEWLPAKTLFESNDIKNWFYEVIFLLFSSSLSS